MVLCAKSKCLILVLSLGLVLAGCRSVSESPQAQPVTIASNIVAWLPMEKILFGGCLVKSLDSNSLGNTKDGDLAAYPATLRKVEAAYPRARIVVPGHGACGGPELIEHTLQLCARKSPEP
jgi:hypothetical protein